jgi:hypothetical protein
MIKERNCTPFRRRDSSSSLPRPISTRCGEVGAEIVMLVFGMTRVVGGGVDVNKALAFQDCRAGLLTFARSAKMLSPQGPNRQKLS